MHRIITRSSRSDCCVTFVILSVLSITCAFALVPLERDEIVLSGNGKISNGKYLAEFNVPANTNGLYLDLGGLNDYAIYLNSTLVCAGKHGNGTKVTVDLSNGKHLLTHSSANRLEIASTDEGAVFSYSLWQSRSRWYYGTFHSHTTYSDGVHSVSWLLNAINDRGGNFCAITDHNTLDQCYDTAFHRTGNCEPIRGTEWTTDSGHANVLGPEGADTFPLMRRVFHLLRDRQ